MNASSSAPSTQRMVRGFAAVMVAAAVLCAAVLLLVSGTRPQPGDSPTRETRATEEPTEPPVIIPENPYGPEDFAYEGGYMTCLAGSARLGVDVSAHQGEIDWEQVREAGVEFAIIRIGYRGYTSGGLYEDEYARANLEGAREAGLEVGAYFYSQALNPEEAREEAQFCLEILDGFELDFPMVYDWEYVSSEARTADMDRDTLMECIRGFCGEVELAGYRPMVYFNPTMAQSLLELEELLEYPWWLAMYSDEMSYPYQVEMWQYTATGSVPGISGDTDLNLWLGA